MCNSVWIWGHINKCTMLKRCCCFDLRTGSVLIGAVRLMSWLIILTGISYVVWELFILRNSGMIHFKTMENLEQNGKFLSEEYIALWYIFNTTLNCNRLRIFLYYFSVRASFGHDSVPYWGHPGVVDDHSSSTT